ncbi:MAG: hypothetical protein HUK25_02000 [Treponema sp.]|nr:hypothetical protein [Treponema sp.]
MLIKKIGKPKLTVILYAPSIEIGKRLRTRDVNDSDIKKVNKSETIYKKMISFCKAKTLDSFECISSLLDDEKIIQKLKMLKDNSTVFLDKIDLVSIDVQNEIIGLFETEWFSKKNILFISGSEKNLEEIAQKGTFSMKLAYRLGLVKENVCSLNEIKSGAKSMAWIILNDSNIKSGKNIKGFSEAALNLIESHYWKNGVFELNAAIDWAVSACETEYISEENLPFINSVSNDINAVVLESLSEDKTMKTALDSFKRYYVTKILEENGNNQTQAAKILGLQRTYVSRLLNELNIR